MIKEDPTNEHQFVISRVYLYSPENRDYLQ